MPSLLSITGGSLGAFNFQVLPDVEPFSIRSGASYEEVLSTIRVWLRDELVPYLQTDSVQATFQSNIDTLIDRVNTALTDQALTVTTALNTAVNEVVTRDVPVTDATVLAVLNTVGTSTLAWLRAHFASGVSAPPPSGGDDTAILQPLLIAAQQTTGKLSLGPGTYLANLATAQSFAQPIITGAGPALTTIQAAVNTAPVLKFKGGSGRLSGGAVRDLTILASAAGGGTGLQLADANGVHWSNVRIDGAFANGIQWLNEAGFTEFCSGDADIRSAVVTAARYSKNSGQSDSFHGSGLTKGTVINQAASATSPSIIIDAGCKPYGAPLDATVFVRTSGAKIISNTFNNSVATFQGNLDVEVQSNATVVYVADPTGTVVSFQGHVNGLITGDHLLLGKCYLTEKTYYTSTGAAIERKQWRETHACTTGDNILSTDNVGETSLVQVEFIASNYHYAFLLHVWQSPYNAGGVVTTIANMQTINGAAYGPPTFSFANYKLVATNANWPVSGVEAYVSVLPFADAKNTDKLQQYNS